MKLNFTVFKPALPVIPCKSRIIQKGERSFTSVVTSPEGEKIVTVNSISNLIQRLKDYQKQRGK